jgi:hypothetical protein
LPQLWKDGNQRPEKSVAKDYGDAEELPKDMKRSENKRVLLSMLKGGGDFERYPSTSRVMIPAIEELKHCHML